MTEAPASVEPRPIFDFLKLPRDGEPYLEGTRCGACGALYLGPRLACARCLVRDGFGAVRLARTGRVHAYSIVHQSLPGIPTPYVSAIVDLDGGGAVKANLLEVAPEPEAIPFGLPVELVTFTAPRADENGRPVIAFGFRPRGDASRGGSR